MKHIHYIKLACLMVSLVLTGVLSTACTDTVLIGQVDEGRYEVGDGSITGYISDSDGKRMVTNVDFREEGDVALYLKTSEKLATDVTIAVTYDETVLADYNTKHGTSYEAFPQGDVTLAGEGVITLPAGSVQSPGMKVSFVSDGNLSSEMAYVIPLRMKVTSGDFKLTEADQTRLIFVKDLTSLPDPAKSTGIQIISCMEVNDTNPLNNLCFTLKESGKPLIDMVILFSANINYNPENGRVYVFNNENVQHLLDNREKYLKPLQDRGIKVVLGILGNHDRSGVANLSVEAAQEFAKEMKAMADAYHLDGFFFDDEYSAYQTPVPPGFVTPSNDAAARLMYEAKKVMPDKLMCAYVYSRTANFPNPIDGVYAGDFVDWGIHDYGGSYDLSSRYPGLQKSGMALYSQEFARNYYTTQNNLRNLRNNGYGGHMIFAMDPYRTNFTSRQLPALQLIASTLFDDELTYNGEPYAKDW